MAHPPENPVCHRQTSRGICGQQEGWHYPESKDPWQPWAHRYVPPPDLPDPEDIASALVVTEWTCPFCGEENDVWGEGAIHSWMECAKCGKYAWLEMDPDRGQ